MLKHTIIINGVAGAGKDTFIDCFKESCDAGLVLNVSSIDPIKEMTKLHLWDGVSKTNKLRKLWSEIKNATIDYNNFPFLYLKEKLKNFISSDSQFLFVHIREPQEIKKFKLFSFSCGIKTSTLLIKRGLKVHFGIGAEDFVETFKYDYQIENNGTVQDLKERSEMFKISLLK